jgi:membrane-associated phospholipid phosphatase
VKLTRWVALAAHPVTIGAGALATAVVLRRRGLATRFVVGLPLGVLVSKIIKRAMPRRKPRLLTLTPRESMPSGHVTATTTFAVTLVDAFSAWRAAPFAAGAVCFVAACRVHDREHRVSEVLVGAVIGLAAAAAASLVARTAE